MTTNEGRIALRVKQPRTLEPEGETSAKFKTWRTAVLNFLGQDMDMDQFLPGGRYSTWIAANSSARGDKGRLTSLFEKQAHHGDDYDCDKVTVAQVKAAADRGGQLDLSQPLAAQLLDLPSSLTERMLTPTGPTPTSSCSPTPPTTPLVTPVATPDTSPETLNVAPPRLLPQGQDIARDVLERHRHWSIGGGETEQERLYPMLEWAPRSRHPPPSC